VRIAGAALVLALAFALLTFAPLVGITGRGIGALNLLFAVLGATYIVGGVLDHLELTRVLPNVPYTDETGDAMAGVGGAR